jgi:hypothetical protein
MGGNLTQLDERTLALLTNQEVIDVNQHSTGGRQVSNESEKIVWAARAQTSGVLYLALFNVADTTQTIEYPLQSLGVQSTSYAMRDLWDHKDLGTSDRAPVTLRPHASVLIRVSASK